MLKLNFLIFSQFKNVSGNLQLKKLDNLNDAHRCTFFMNLTDIGYQLDLGPDIARAPAKHESHTPGC